MAYNYDQDMGYNMGQYYNRPYNSYERDDYYRPAYGNDAGPVMYRKGEYGRRREPAYFDNYRRDYRQGAAYTDGRYGVVPLEDQVMYRREELAPEWMDDGYRRHGGQLQVGRGYRVDRHDHHGGRNYGHGNLLRLEDGYDRRVDPRHHNNHGHSSRTEVELYVPICCDKCERKLRKHLEYIEGVETIITDQTTKRVVVYGNVNPSHVLSRARHDKPESEFWHSRPR